MSRTLDHQSKPPAIDAPAPGARAALLLLLAINLFNYIDRYVVASVEPQIAKAFFGGKANDAATLAKTGSLATAFLVSYLITAPILGWLADRMSRWLLVGLSVAIWSLATGASGLAPTFTVLLLTRCFVGIGEGGYGPAAPTLISDLYPVSRRGVVLSWFYMAIPVGSAIGFAVGGLVGAESHPHGWRWAFFVVTPPGLLLAAWCFFMRDPPRGQSDALAPEASAKKPTWRDYLALARNPSYVLDCAGMTAMSFAIGGISFWMPRYLTQAPPAGRGLPENSKLIFGIIVATTGLFATLAGGLAGDKLKRRYPGSYFLVSGAAIILACPFLLVMLLVPFPWAWVMMFLACFFLFFNTGPTNTILANVTHPSIRATAFAVNILVIHLFGDAASPPVLGGLAGRFGWNAAFGLVAAAMTLAGILWLWGARHLERDMERALIRAPGAGRGFPVVIPVPPPDGSDVQR